MVFISATFLRLNNVGMVQRRDAVMVADEQGNGEVTRNRVLDLQHHVSLHMNTGQNDVYLASQYERDRAALIQQAAQSSESGEVINQKVDAICKPQFSGYSQAYVECFAREYAKYSPGGDPVSQVKMPDKDKYRFVFAPPLWSPDFAGFAILGCIVIVLVIIGRLLTLVILRLLLKRKYQDV